VRQAGALGDLSWAIGHPAVNLAGIYDVVEEFLRNTQRVVSVVVFATYTIELRDREMMLLRHRFKEFLNPTHRFDRSKRLGSI
jgi:hypothetical protein